MVNIINKPSGRGVCNNLTHFYFDPCLEKVLHLLAELLSYEIFSTGKIEIRLGRLSY